ncbi:MAG TPA: hypothetical protein VKX17_15135 [Planctomycetota bacterium]|nr:hypothetical protein [Planctomycetota bacterium]
MKISKQRLILYVLAYAARVALSADEKPKDEEVRSFTGKVEQVLSKGEFSGKAIVVDADPRWIVVVSVLKAEKGVDPETKTLTYFIHSPTRLFAKSGDEAIGKELKFVESLSKSPDGKTSFRHLKAKGVN